MSSEFRVVAWSEQGVNRAHRILNNIKPSEKHEWEIIIKPYKRNRTQEQNRLYWAWLGEIARETGADAEELHEAYKRKFLAPLLKRDDEGYRELSETLAALRKEGQHDSAEKLGLLILSKLSTSELNVKQMTEYLNEVDKHAADFHGITLTQPPDKR